MAQHRDVAFDDVWSRIRALEGTTVPLASHGQIDILKVDGRGVIRRTSRPALIAATPPAKKVVIAKMLCGAPVLPGKRPTPRAPTPRIVIGIVTDRLPKARWTNHEPAITRMPIAAMDTRWSGALFALNPRTPDAARHFAQAHAKS